MNQKDQWELCENCYEFPRLKTRTICRRCVALERATRRFDEAVGTTAVGNVKHLQLLKETGKTYRS